MLLRGTEKLGKLGMEQWQALRYEAAVIGTAVYFSFLPCSWDRKRRTYIAEQVFAVGVEPLFFVAAVAIFVGVSVVVQLAFWTGRAGQTQLLGPLLVAVVARELGPILANIIVITRSSSAMAMELAFMKTKGVIIAMDDRGEDPFTHVVLPRVIGFGLSTFCLTVLFILVALMSGYFFGAWLGTGSRDLSYFSQTVLAALHPKDMLSISVKSILPALFSGATCCIAGLNVRSGLEIPRATQRALTRSVAGLFIISALVSVATYL